MSLRALPAGFLAPDPGPSLIPCPSLRFLTPFSYHEPTKNIIYIKQFEALTAFGLKNNIASLSPFFLFSHGQLQVATLQNGFCFVFFGPARPADLSSF